MNDSHHESPALPWSERPFGDVRVAMLSPNHPQLTDEIRHGTRECIQKCAQLVFEDLGSDEPAGLVHSGADVVVVLGGDGSILRAARSMAASQMPVLGVNLGKLGFLAGVSVDDFAIAMQAITECRCRIVSHLMFQCEILRNGERISQTLGLNETAVLGGPPYSILEIDFYVDDEMATTYSCDGLIISTPVGSTAHSLSAGGPILRKDLQSFVISAVSPHTLTVRPVVDAANRVYEVAVDQPNEMTAVVVDGQVIHRLDSIDRVRVYRAEPQFQLIEIPGQTYYQTLREKLGWGGRMASKQQTP